MSHTVAVGEFEGPLGVLLELIDAGKLEVSRVAVGRITSEYLAKVQAMEGVNAEELSEFLQLGARLTYIKSLSLLPAETAAPEAERELDQLSRELAEYRRYQDAARQLAARSHLRTWERPAAPRLAPSELPLPDVTTAQLAAAFSRALAAAPPAPQPALLRRHLSLETVQRRLRGRLAEGFSLEALLEQCHDRLEIVVTFLALLELVRTGEARVLQSDHLAPIRVEAADV